MQYTIILPASKNLPSQVVDFKKGKTQKRKSVGVRYPDEPIAQVGDGVAGCHTSLLPCWIGAELHPRRLVM